MTSNTHRKAVSYIDKTREYYAAQGYDKPYKWASHDDSPFSRLTKPLAECTIGLITTASIPKPGVGLMDDPGLLQTGDVFCTPSDPTPDALYTMDRSWDKEATHTMDLGSFFPLDHLKSLAQDGLIKSVSNRFYGIPTDYSQRQTAENYAPQIQNWLKEDNVDAVLLVPL